MPCVACEKPRAFHARSDEVGLCLMADWCVVILSMKHGSCSSDAPLDCSLKRLKKSTYAAIESWKRMKARIIGMPGGAIYRVASDAWKSARSCFVMSAATVRKNLSAIAAWTRSHRPRESQPLNE